MISQSSGWQKICDNAVTLKSRMSVDKTLSQGAVSGLDLTNTATYEMWRPHKLGIPSWL